MLSADLGAGERLRVAPSESVARLKAELPLPDTDSLSKETLSRIRRNLGTSAAVLGSFVILEGSAPVKLRLDVIVQDTANGETLAAATEVGEEQQLFELVARAGARLRDRLGAGDAVALEATSIRASLPSDREAARLYAEGLARLRRFDAIAARDLLTRSVAKETTFPLAHSALAEAWSRLGEDGKAREEAKKAIESSATLPRAEKLLVEGRALDVMSERARAVDAYRALVSLSPANL